ncbi:MAG: hypothetical protein ABL931_16240 [Usitatibacteraceae bacterium]
MTSAEAIAYLNSRSANEVREAATFYFAVAGADWDSKVLSTLRNGQWYRHVDGPAEHQKTVLHIGVADYLRRTAN